MAQRAVSAMEAWVRNTEGVEAFVPLDAGPNAHSAGSDLLGIISDRTAAR